MKTINSFFTLVTLTILLLNVTVKAQQVWVASIEKEITLNNFQDDIQSEVKKYAGEYASVSETGDLSDILSIKVIKGQIKVSWFSGKWNNGIVK